ncbi:exopolysaccharide biosynthesis protein [Paenibacillus castaneae]|uniref:phosphodiester glycosidase family protein n=1 Tax=Paenibacillus castaneae TaxID=474957 RepID=UPI00141AD0CA|nr:phosphodiester glycosidase family protein [Paenibacillus castaneae]NIK79072.1 exopolysaccharide biosynthesis protein [Paenibacillus castaneae]
MHLTAGRWGKRGIAALVVAAMGLGYTGNGGVPLEVNAVGTAAAAKSAGYIYAAGVAASNAAGSSLSITETKYWSYTAEGTLHPALSLSNGNVFAATANGWLLLVDGNGKEIKRINSYTSLSAPAVNERGQIFAAGKGARLYQYDGAGNGGQKAIFYFKGKKEELQPSSIVIDGEGIPYYAYQHAILSLDLKGEKQAALLPEGVTVKSLAAGKSGAYALGSNGTLYAVRASGVVWEAAMDETLLGAKLVADVSGGVMLLAGKAIAAYEADGAVRFTRELAAAPAGGWTSPVLMPGDEGAVVAAELSGNDIAAFRLADGAELWRISASGAGGFGPAALAPDREAGLVLAGGRSGALYAIDGKAASIAYTYGGNAAVPASGVAPQGGGRIVYTSASKLIAAGPFRPVAVSYAAASIKLPLGTRLLLTDKLKLSAPVAVSYRSDNPAVVRINDKSILTSVSAGTANIIIDVTTSGYKGQLKLPVQVTAADSKLKVKHESKKVAVSGKTFTVQTVTIPKGMPVTAGIASRQVGTVQKLADITKTYQADAAINATYFEAYGGIPEPYGTIIADGNVEHIGNTGTAIGFTWDGTVLMDSLRVKITGGTNGSFKSPNNWYAYFINRTPVEGKSTAIMFTPKRGAKLGFAMGTAVTVRNGVVTKISKKENVSIPADGYVLVYTGSEETLASRFQVGTVVDYKVEMTNLSGQPIDWSRVHTAAGAGPRLVKDGKLAVNPAEEGFSSPKILTDSAMRSGIMVQKDGTVLVATVPNATMKQWGQIMLQLGAQQAMNLDGGASSGLYAQGKLITVPGRLISNTIVFGTNLKW